MISLLSPMIKPSETGQNVVIPPEFIAAHRDVVADKLVQFSITEQLKPPEWPKYLGWIIDFMQAVAPFAAYIFWGLVALVAGSFLFFIMREFGYLRWPWRKAIADEDSIEDEWMPGAAPARALLTEADALAARGEFSAAAHLLLLRSVEDIDLARPDILKPSTTAREISNLTRLPEKARLTFALIARHVEASLFGGHAINAETWQQCRDAYGRFAFAGEWASEP
jgi:hypothetical protein